MPKSSAREDLQSTIARLRGEHGESKQPAGAGPGELADLQAECAKLTSTVQRVIAETGATIDALTAQTNTALRDLMMRYQLALQRPDADIARLRKRPLGFQPPEDARR